MNTLSKCLFRLVVASPSGPLRVDKFIASSRQFHQSGNMLPTVHLVHANLLELESLANTFMLDQQ